MRMLTSCHSFATTQAPADLKAVAAFLRGKNGPKIRRGVLNGKRVDYFKGELMIICWVGLLVEFAIEIHHHCT